MGKGDTHNYPIVMTLDGMFPPKIKEATVSGGTTTTYEGWSEKGAKTSEANWKIRKTVAVVSGGTTTTTITYPNADDNFSYVWDDRASLTYAN